MPSRVKDDRPISDKVYEGLTSSRFPGGASRRESVGMPTKTRDEDVQLGPKKGPLEGLKKAAEGYKKAKEKGVFK